MDLTIEVMHRSVDMKNNGKYNHTHDGSLCNNNMKILQELPLCMLKTPIRQPILLLLTYIYVFGVNFGKMKYCDFINTQSAARIS